MSFTSGRFLFILGAQQFIKTSDRVYTVEWTRVLDQNTSEYSRSTVKPHARVEKTASFCVLWI